MIKNTLIYPFINAYNSVTNSVTKKIGGFSLVKDNPVILVSYCDYYAG